MAGDYCKSGHKTIGVEYDFSDDNAPEISAKEVTLPGGDNLESIAKDVTSCKNCSLSATRTRAVPGEGVKEPLIMVIGEGPGFDEDKTGRPFVGKAGQLLDRMLSSIGLSREKNCFITNVVKCRPPNNRDPEDPEVAACSSFLLRQVTLLRPRILLSLGRVATQALLENKEPIGATRGRFVQYSKYNLEIPLLATYHPSALLRNENLKRPAWEDLKKLKDALLLLVPDYESKPQGHLDGG